MKSISSQDYYIPYEQMSSLHEKGQLNFGIDRLTGQHMTNNTNILDIADDPNLLKATWKAHNFWTYAMLGGFSFTVYLSFTSAWWWFLVGFLGMGFMNKMLIKSNEANLLDVMIKDKGLYEAMHTAKRLNFLVDETIVPSLQKREEDNETINTSVDAYQIVGDFGAIMEKHDWLTGFYDSSELPHSKEDIKNALVSAHSDATDDEMKSSLRTGLMALSHFQKGIGQEPLRGGHMFNFKPSSDNLSQEEQTKEMAEWIKEEDKKIDKKELEEREKIANIEWNYYKSLIDQ